MIADWTVEIASDGPIIEMPWSGWSDLRWDASQPWQPARAELLDEVRAYPELLEMLRIANDTHTQTAKVDMFPVDSEDVDPEIAELGAEATAHGLGNYLDILLREASTAGEFPYFEQIAAKAVLRLKKVSSPLAAYVEVVVRPARLYDTETFGWTVYATGFGADLDEARKTWNSTVYLAVEALLLEIATTRNVHVGE